MTEWIFGWTIPLIHLIKHKRCEKCSISMFCNLKISPFIGNKAKTFSNGSLWNLFLTNICARQTVVWSSLQKNQSRFAETSSHLALVARLRVVRPRQMRGERSHGPGSLTIHIYRAAAHTLPPTHGRHISPHNSDTPSGQCLEKKRSVEFWVMAVVTVPLGSTNLPAPIHNPHRERNTH